MRCRRRKKPLLSKLLRLDLGITGWYYFSVKTTLLTQKGQITIPKELRDAFGWKQSSELAFVKEADGVKIVAVADKPGAVIEKMKRVHWIGPSADQLLAETRSEV